MFNRTWWDESMKPIFNVFRRVWSHLGPFFRNFSIFFNRNDVNILNVFRQVKSHWAKFLPYNSFYLINSNKHFLQFCWNFSNFFESYVILTRIAYSWIEFDRTNRLSLFWTYFVTFGHIYGNFSSIIPSI